MLLAAALLAVAILQAPNLVAANTSEHGLWLAPWLMWAVCCGVMHGLGFHPRSLIGRAVCPWLAWPSLLYGLWLTQGYFLSQKNGEAGFPASPASFLFSPAL